MNVEMAIGKRVTLVVTNVENKEDVQLARLTPVVEELKATLLNADFYLPMTIQPLPEARQEEYIKTNLKWHS
jgi:hypothetical protein